MANPKHKLNAILTIAALLAVAAVVGTAAQKDSTPKPQNKLAMAEDHVKQLLLLMESDKQGKISKQQFMKFMEAEFERLDTTKKGELDVKQLTTATVTAKNYVGK
jgi:hypothetical protein